MNFAPRVALAIPEYNVMQICFATKYNFVYKQAVQNLKDNEYLNKGHFLVRPGNSCFILVL
jgi:hypothetical protein